MPLTLQSLHPRYGAVIEDVDLRDVTENHLFAEIRQAFEQHSLLFFPAQSLDDDAHVRLADLFGPKEDREAMASGRNRAFTVSAVSNETGKGVTDAEAMHTLHLKANMLWHTDSTFLPVPALANILTAAVVPSTGGETQFASTRAAWADMPDTLKTPLRNAIIWHRYAHSRARISRELAMQPMFTQWPDRPWRAVWRNPVTGDDALFIASHAFAIEGMGLHDGQALIDDAIAFCTRPEYVYSHEWTPGDVLIWDERAILHRGQPWPYGEPRTLKSICVSVTNSDGLDKMRVLAEA